MQMSTVHHYVIKETVAKEMRYTGERYTAVCKPFNFTRLCKIIMAEEKTG